MKRVIGLPTNRAPTHPGEVLNEEFLKPLAIKQKVKSALIYPTAVIVVAFAVLTVIMIFVIPSFKEVFTSFGAELPYPTLVVMGMSDFFVHYWWLIFGLLFGGGYTFLQAWRRSEKMQFFMDRALLKAPIFVDLRNIYRPAEMQAAGFQYSSLGRSA